MSEMTATYRIQFRNGFSLEDAARLTGYLDRLGVSHLYASPINAAAEGSTHGYDGIDFLVVEPAIGGEAGYRALTEALEKDRLGLLLDFVPNHMATAGGNAWWEAALEWGEKSPHAETFDIDWTAPKLLLPTLGTGYAEALRDGQFGLAFDSETGRLFLTVYEHRLPLTPPSYRLLLETVRAPEFGSLAQRFASVTPTDADVVLQALADAARENPRALADAIEAASADSELMHAIHEAQVWRLCHWRMAREALTYRRFFEITTLIGVRVEDEHVFQAVHAWLLDEIRAGHIDGVRLDHIDGLSDPKRYLEMLHAAAGEGVPLLVEKILEHGEALPDDWPVRGTTGYEFIAALAGLFTDGARESAMSEAYADFAGTPPSFEDAAAEAKRHLFEHNLAAELTLLTGWASELVQSRLETRDIAPDSLRRAILELAVALPVYRTYVDEAGPDEADLALIAQAAEAVGETRRVENEAAIDFVASLLRLEHEDRDAALAFTLRFQQTSGPVMAKGLEDTLFYRFNRLIALNEVGGAPDEYGASLNEFHAAMAERLESQPGGLSATSTHDTKRGEDARARLYALSEMPEVWASAVDRWAGMNAPLRANLPEGPAPEPAAEWMLYQALAGAWPLGAAADDVGAMASLRDRMGVFMEKSIREAKTRTSWTAQHMEYEAAVAAFSNAVQTPETCCGFLQDFEETCRPLWVAGALTSLSQLAVKLTAPGVPDIYQGCELWDFSMVDPDNRRPVDFEARRMLLEANDGAEPEALVGQWIAGAPKLALTRAGLQLRRSRPDLFAKGGYEPLQSEGLRAGNLLAFARMHGGQAVLTIAPRLVLGLVGDEAQPMVPAESWQDTMVKLPEDLRGLGWRNVVTGELHDATPGLPASVVLGRFPVAILASVDG